eukprot:scaffold12650_cov34-Prasinocladus_malaysianus.AAC.1
MYSLHGHGECSPPSLASLIGTMMVCRTVQRLFSSPSQFQKMGAAFHTTMAVKVAGSPHGKHHILKE